MNTRVTVMTLEIAALVQPNSVVHSAIARLSMLRPEKARLSATKPTATMAQRGSSLNLVIPGLSGPFREIGIAQFDQPGTAKAGTVAGMHDFDRESEQPLHGAHIGRDVGAVDLVQQRSVIDCVAGEQGAGLRLPQPDAAGRMAGQ